MDAAWRLLKIQRPGLLLIFILMLVLTFPNYLRMMMSRRMRLIRRAGIFRHALNADEDVRAGALGDWFARFSISQRQQPLLQ